MWRSRSAPVPADSALSSSFRYWDRRGVALLTGRSGIYAMAHIWQARLALRGCSVHVIDCAIRADAQGLVEEALRNGVAPELLLQAITLQRAFTPYQILDVLRAELKHASEPGRILFILAPCKQFFDGDVAGDECAFLLKKLVAMFQKYQREGRALLIVESESYPADAFLPVYQQLKLLAQTLFEFQGQTADRAYALAVRRRGESGLGEETKKALGAGSHRASRKASRKTLSKTIQGQFNHGSDHHALFHSNANGGGSPQGFQTRSAAG